MEVFYDKIDFMKKNYNNDLYTLSYKMKKERQGRILKWILKIFIVFIILNVVVTFVIFPVKEKSNSMTPDIPKKSLLFVTPIITEINRGNVLLIDKDTMLDSVPKKILNTIIRFFTFRQKGLYSTADSLSCKNVLRRVVAVPGDTVYMKDFIVYVKPQDEKFFLSEFEVINKNYDIAVFNLPENWDDSIGFKSGFSPITLGPNEYFMLADNRSSGLDSRHWGVINRKDIVAKALLLYFPFNKIKLY